MPVIVYCGLQSEYTPNKMSYPSSYEDEEPIETFQDVTTMTNSHLKQAMDEIHDDRKYLSRKVRKHTKGVWSEDDVYMMEQMNKWAKMVFDELMRRSDEQAKKLKLVKSAPKESALWDKESLSSTSNQRI